MSRIIIPGKSAHPDFALPGRQPVGEVNIDEAWKNRVAFSCIPGKSTADYVSTTTSAKYGTITRVVSQYGVAAKASSASSTRWEWNAKPLASLDSGYAILMVATPAVASGFQRAFLIGDEAASAYSQVGIGFNSSESAGLDSLRISHWEYSNSFKASAKTTNTIVDGTRKIIIVNRPGGASAPTIYINGINATFSSTASAGFNPPKGVMLFGWPTSTASGAIDPIELVTVFRSPLSLGEIRALSGNPYGTFRPANDPIFFIPSAGGTTITGTGSLAAGTASTSGTAEREVTGTGTAASGAATTSGAAEREITGTSTLASGAATTSGTAEREITGTSALASGAATTAGTAEREITGTSSLASGAATTSGTAEREITGTSALLSGAATTSGAGVMSRNATGTLLSEAATLEGVGTVGTPAKRHIRPATMLISGAATMAGEGEVIAA